MKADRKLYLTDGGQVVEEGDRRATSLFAGEGYEISDADAAKYGLSEADGKVVIGKVAAKAESAAPAESGAADQKAEASDEDAAPKKAPARKK